MDNLKPLVTLIRNESASPNWHLLHSVIMAPKSNYKSIQITDSHQYQAPPGDTFPGVKVELFVTKDVSVESLNIMTPLVHICKIKAGLVFDTSNPFIEVIVIEEVVDELGNVTNVTKNKSIVRHQDADIDDAD